MLDKQRDELNESFAALEARFSALDKKNAHSEVVEVSPKEKPNLDKARVETPPKLDGPFLHAKPYEYPLERVPMPHMNPSFSAPPMLDEFNYSYWKSCMCSHLRCVCVELWGIVENGYTPINENYLTTKERIECQLNSTVLDKIAKVLSVKCMIKSQALSPPRNFGRSSRSSLMAHRQCKRPSMKLPNKTCTCFV
jgi:hypothetical protein